jgi:hypothetical protein
VLLISAAHRMLLLRPVLLLDARPTRNAAFWAGSSFAEAATHAPPRRPSGSTPSSVLTASPSSPRGRPAHRRVRAPVSPVWGVPSLWSCGDANPGGGGCLLSAWKAPTTRPLRFARVLAPVAIRRKGRDRPRSETRAGFRLGGSRPIKRRPDSDSAAAPRQGQSAATTARRWLSHQPEVPPSGPTSNDRAAPTTAAWQPVRREETWRRPPPGPCTSTDPGGATTALRLAPLGAHRLVPLEGCPVWLYRHHAARVRRVPAAAPSAQSRCRRLG